jgi:16S rRNA (guanine966-N2)-methyltransferase
MPDAGRVVTGRAKGLRLEAPGAGTRPLSDRLKQSLFATLAAQGAVGEGSSFLDLFAGSGAAGIEALSRGAARVVLVERDARASRVIEANLRRAGLSGGLVVRADVLGFLRGEPASVGGPFDACLVDPPYNQPLLEPVLALLGDSARGWLSDTGIVVAKHFWRDAPDSRLADLQADRHERYGETMLTFYARRR